MTTNVKRSLREEARLAKNRLKGDFWTSCQEDFTKKKELAKEQGMSETKVGQYFKSQLEAIIEGREEDTFYAQVKEILEKEGEVSDAIGRLTDHAYYDTLSYEEKQRYTLALSEKYVRALEKFRYECEFDFLNKCN